MPEHMSTLDLVSIVAAIVWTGTAKDAMAGNDGITGAMDTAFKIINAAGTDPRAKNLRTSLPFP